MTWDKYLARFPRGKGYLAGWLPWRAQLEDVVTNAPRIPFSLDGAPGAEIVQIKAAEIEQLNQDHSYRALDEPTKVVLREIFQGLKPAIAHWLQSPWRVLNCRSWTTKRGAAIGPNSWHMDGDHPGILKMMLYGTPTGGEYGGIELLDFSLKGDGWIVFYSSVVRHRGVAPAFDDLERVATEVTLCPSREFDLEPKFLGLAARKPLQP